MIIRIMKAHFVPICVNNLLELAVETVLPLCFIFFGKNIASIRQKLKGVIVGQ
ncbi:hypothetical protein ES703_123620 [subsurface metagenome]